MLNAPTGLQQVIGFEFEDGSALTLRDVRGVLIDAEDFVFVRNSPDATIDPFVSPMSIDEFLF